MAKRNFDINYDNDEFDEDFDEDEIDYHSESKFAKLLGRVLSLVIAFNMASAAWNFFFSDKNQNRKYLLDNLYVGKNFSSELSDDDIDKIVEEFEEKFKVDIEAEYEDEYCLLNAISENPNLTEIEKNFFYKYIDAFLDNPYLDKEMVYYALLNVDVKHTYRPAGADISLEGIYDFVPVDIELYVEDSDKSVLGHEGFHCIYSNEKTAALPDYFKEGITELFNNEYFSDNPYVELTNYPFEVAAVKMLCNLTSSDAVLKAISYGSMDYIAEELADISESSLDEAKVALDGLNIMFKNFRGKEAYTQEVLDQTFDNTFDYFDRSITTKSEDDHQRISYYYNMLLLLNMFFDNPYDAYYDDLLEHGYERKAYFSSKLIQENTNNYSKSDVSADEVKVLEKNLS